MTTTYVVALDKNGDGFINTHASPTDPPNLVPTPVTYAQLPVAKTGTGTTYSLNREEFPYGIHYLRVQTLGSAAGAIYAGTFSWTASPVDIIPVTAGHTYTASVWLRGVTNYAGAGITMSVYHENKTLIAQNTPAITADWARFDQTFTAGAGDSFVAIALERPAGAINVLFDVAGFMLVAGSSAPAAFNAGDDLDDSITADVLAMDWRLGMAAAYEHVAAPTAGKLILRNEDRRNSPIDPLETGVTALLPGRRIRILATNASTSYTLFTGSIARVEPTPGEQGERLATVYLDGPESQFKTVRVLAPLLLNARANNVIAQIMSTPPLDRYNYLFESGNSVFAYVADTWADGIAAQAPIRQVMEAERGRFFTDHDGRLRLYNRQHLQNANTVAATFDDNVEALDYTFGEGLVNEVRVAVRPRMAGSAGSTLWQLDNAQLVKPGALNARRIIARMRDSNDNPMGALSVTTPVATTDYTANTMSDGTGTDVTAYLSVSVVAVHASAVDLQLTNSYSANIYIMPGSKLRGTPLLQSDPMLVSRSDITSINAHGLRALDFNLPFLVSIEDADQLARYELSRRKRPFGAARSLSISTDSPALTDQILARTLFDRITVHDTQVRHKADYFIVAEQHTVDLGGYRHRVTWTLEAANPGGFWQLGRSHLTENTRLGRRY